MSVEEAALNLRERKALRTQQAIVRATAELTLEIGYAAVTIPRIAERADVAPRTVSRWFPVKDEILFGNIAEIIDRAREYFARDEGDTVEHLRSWLAGEIEIADAEDREADRDLDQLKLRVIEGDPELRARGIQHFDELRDMVSLSLARDLGLSPDALPVHALAGAMMGLLSGIRHSRLGLEEPEDQQAWRQQILRDFDRFYAYLGTGIATFREPAE